MAEQVSNKPWSEFQQSDYNDEQWLRACLIVRPADSGTAKQRGSLPVREPDGTLNRNACHAAAAVLSSVGGTGSARGHKLKATPEEMAAAKKKLISLYNSALGDQPPPGLMRGMGMMQQDDPVTAFLAHHGVKGMKWGIRRSAASLARAAGRPVDATPKLKGNDIAARIRMRHAKPGSVVMTKEGQVFLKKEDGTWRETHLSADAERVVKTSQKAQHEMSDRELKEAANRARLIEDYNKFFGPDPNKQLQQQVQQLELQKKYSEIHSVLHPSRKTKVAGFVATSAGAYKAYQKLNKESGGELGKQIRGGLVRAGMVSTVGKHTVGVPLKQRVAKDVVKTVAKDAVKEAV